VVFAVLAELDRQAREQDSADTKVRASCNPPPYQFILSSSIHLLMLLLFRRWASTKAATASTAWRMTTRMSPVCSLPACGALVKAHWIVWMLWTAGADSERVFTRIGALCVHTLGRIEYRSQHFHS
jgi:hypothetical protein